METASLSEQVFLPLSLCCSDSSKGKKESPYFGLPLLSTLLKCHQASAFRRNHALRKFSSFPTLTTRVIYIHRQTTGKCTREVRSLTQKWVHSDQHNTKKLNLASKAKSPSPFPKGQVKRLCHSIQAGRGHKAEGDGLVHPVYSCFSLEVLFCTQQGLAN